MAIPAAILSGGNGEKDGHEHDLVMPGFRFHPTEEELIEFYLRRKVEGKRFNVEFITFLDLYRYDPWELPEFATIGEKEWFFYVPRDRKYRNGDRPNRVTTSGYWKATGVDKMIRSENYSRPIGLKKTLVFYSGRAPKGIRTSWIMNEYRLPLGETDRYQKAEISLCRVYKRGGVDRLSGVHRPSSSEGTGPDKMHKNNHHPSTLFTTLTGDSSSPEIEKIHEVGVCSSTEDISVYSTTAPVLNNMTASVEEDGISLNSSNTLVPTGTLLPSVSSSIATPRASEFNKMVGYRQDYLKLTNKFVPVPLQPRLIIPNSLATISDNLCAWNPLHEAGKDFTNFK